MRKIISLFTLFSVFLLVSGMSSIIEVQAAKISSDDYTIRNPLSDWNGFDINVYRSKSTGLFYSDLDASDYMWLGDEVTYYVDPVSGNDSNNGLSRETAFQTLNSAFVKTDVDIIRIIDDGWLNFVQAFDNQTVTKNLSIIADEGKVVYISTATKGTYSKTGGYTNIYQANRILLKAVVDISDTEDNDFIHYTQVMSLEAVDSTPGSYYYSSDIVYVHTFDSRIPDDDVKLMLNTRNIYVNGYYHIYLENLNFYGGGDDYSVAKVESELSETQKSIFVAKNVTFRHTWGTGIRVVRLLNTKSILQNVTVENGSGDGISYGNDSHGIEMNVNSMNHGLNGDGSTHNGSTGHDGSKIIRLNSTYHSTAGPVLHDVHVGTESWNIQVNAYNSTSIHETLRTGFRSSENGKMWIYSSESSLNDYDVYSAADSDIYIYDNSFDSEKTYIDVDNGNITEQDMVIFDTNGGFDINPLFVNHDETFIIPIPLKSGYSFQNWYLDEALTSLFTSETPVTEDITLYAKWISGGTGVIIPPENDISTTLYGFVAAVVVLGGLALFNTKKKKG